MSPLRWTRLLICLLAPAQLTHVNSQACCLVPDPQGNLYVIGTANANISITKLNPAHQIVTTFEFGGGSLDQPHAATLDPPRQPPPRPNRSRLPRRLYHPGQPRHRPNSLLHPHRRPPNLPVSVLYQDRSLEVLYVGYAPGLVANLLQINLRLPSSSGSSFQLMIGSEISAPFSLYF